jgi:hypothetical protein
VRYPSGQPVRVSTTVRELDGTPAAPATLVLTVQAPDGTRTDYGSPSSDVEGTYYLDVPAAGLTQLGHYQYAWVATGDGAGVAAGSLDVYDPFEVRVLSLQDAKDMLAIPQSATTHDAELDGWIASIESGLEKRTGGPVVTRSFTERCELDGTMRALLVRQRPLVSVTSIVSVASNTPIDISAGLDIDANSGVIRTRLGWPFIGPFFAFRPAMIVTGTAGWGTSVPAAFRTFAEITIQHLWSTRRGPVAMPMGGEQLVTVPGFGYAVPNAAAELLDGSQDGIPFTVEAYV